MDGMFYPMPQPSQALDSIVDLIGDPNALVGPSGEETLLMEYNGQEYLIPADMDTESATLTTSQGINILADTDGDGRVDYVSSVDYEGNWAAWRWNNEEHATTHTAANTTAQDATLSHTPLDGEETMTSDIETSDSTPTMGQLGWDSGAWKCVERGHGTRVDTSDV